MIYSFILVLETVLIDPQSIAIFPKFGHIMFRNFRDLGTKPKILKNQYFGAIFVSKGLPRNVIPQLFYLRRPGPSGAPFWTIFSQSLKVVEKKSIFGSPGVTPGAPSAKMF